MDLYLDTSNLDEIKTAMQWGVIDGVTTNPSLIKKEAERLGNIDLKQHIAHLCSAVGQERTVSLEVTAQDAAGMIAQGKKLYQLFNGIAENVVIKIPIMPKPGSMEGLQAIKALEDAEIPVNCTLVFTPEQALLAAKAGATYVSPFAGRVDDDIRKQGGVEFQKTDYFPSEGWEAESEDGEEEDTLDDNGIVSGIDLVTKIADMFEKHEIDCNVLAASMRNPRQVREAALAGADIATVPFAVLKAMIKHHKTEEGMEKFTADVVPRYAQLLGIPQNSTVSSQPSAAPQQQRRPEPQTPPTQTPLNTSGQNPAQPTHPPSAYDLAQRRLQQ